MAVIYTFRYFAFIDSLVKMPDSLVDYPSFEKKSEAANSKHLMLWMCNWNICYFFRPFYFVKEKIQLNNIPFFRAVCLVSMADTLCGALYSLTFKDMTESLVVGGRCRVISGWFELLSIYDNNSNKPVFTIVSVGYCSGPFVIARVVWGLLPLLTMKWTVALVRCHLHPLVTFSHSWLEMAPHESQRLFYFLNTCVYKQIFIPVHNSE